MTEGRGRSPALTGFVVGLAVGAWLVALGQLGIRVPGFAIFAVLSCALVAGFALFAILLNWVGVPIPPPAEVIRHEVAFLAAEALFWLAFSGAVGAVVGCFLGAFHGRGRRKPAG